MQAPRTALPSALLTAPLVLAACASAPVRILLEHAAPADHLIQPGEEHFAHLWQLTFDGENAEGYFSSRGGQLVFQRRGGEIECDRIFVLDPFGEMRQVSSGRGACTCAFFLPDDRHVIFASTQGSHEDCPPKPDRSKEYAWAIYAEHDIYVHDLDTGEERVLIAGPGYDAEATVSPRGDRIVFTSTRSGDIELWTSDLEGGDLRQVTKTIGYDGGAFFSHAGDWLVYRTTAFTPGAEEAEHARYRDLLAQNLVRPHSMEVMMIRPNGTGRWQVTHLGGANWAPYFFPDDQRIIFSSNHHDDPSDGIDFELFAIGTDGKNLERITWYDEGRGKNFDSFPMFSRDGRYLVFASNRGEAEPGVTNLFIAEWQ